jgi:tetratricopeptide (TPR) repeat protein
LTGNVQEALEQLEEILRRDPKFPSAHYTVGALLLADGQTDLAINEFTSAVEFEPTYLQARLQLANTLSSRGRFEPARQQYADIIEIDPRFAEARFGDAIALVGLKRYAEARDRLAEGMRLHPDRIEFLASLVRVLAAAPDAGVRDGTRALTLAKELVTRQSSASAREAMAMALAEAGRYEEAAMAQREAIAMAERSGQLNLASMMAANLRLFQHGQPSRTPWRERPVWEP